MSPLVITEVGTNVKIKWTPLTSGNGSPVTNQAVKVSIFNQNTNQFDSTTGPHCDGQDVTNIANEFCLVPMATFFSAYGYQVNT
jgi:hypothetical protein